MPISEERTPLRTLERIWTNISSEEISALTLEMIKIASPTGKELDFARFFGKTLEEFGLEVHLYEADGGRPNLFARIRGTGGVGGPNLLLHGHMDTVPIGNCVAPKMEGGRVYGRGSSDMKGSLAAIAIAAKQLVKSRVRLRGDLFIAGTVDHESPPGEGKGIKKLVEFLKKNHIKVDGALNAEGPFDGIKVAQGGCSLFSITLSKGGGTLYSATSSLVSNPILWASDLIRALHKIDMEMEGQKRHPLIPQRPTVQIGIIEGGNFIFTVPDRIRLKGAIRWDPGQSFAEVSREFVRSLKNIQRSLQEKYDQSIKIAVEMRLDREECEVPHNSRIVLSMKRALHTVTGKQYSLTGSRYITDFAVLYKEALIPSVEFGPFLPSDITNHTDHESVKIANLSVIGRACRSRAGFLSGVLAPISAAISFISKRTLNRPGKLLTSGPTSLSL